MGIKDYIKSIAPTPAAYWAIRADAKRKRTSKLSMREIDREIAAVPREHASKRKGQANRVMIRVVVDTNVVVSANVSDAGFSASILDSAANRKIMMCARKTS